MNKPNFIIKAFFLMLVLSAANIFAQTENKPPSAEPCYEVVLQVLLASNKTGEKTALPASLSNPVKKLKTMYSFTDYRVLTTFLQRTTGFIEYKSLFSNFNQTGDDNYPVFGDWSLTGLRNVANAQGRNVLQFDSFRFGARMPVPTFVRDEGGKTSTVINYETSYVNTRRFSLNEGEPTVVSSLAGADPNEMIFLVLTVSAAN